MSLEEELTEALYETYEAPRKRGYVANFVAKVDDFLQIEICTKMDI